MHSEPLLTPYTLFFLYLQKKRAPLLWFITIVAILLELWFGTRGGFLVTWYATHGGLCINMSGNDSNFQPQRIFSSIMYGICSILRCIEYLLLAHGFYMFASNVESNSYWKDTMSVVKRTIKELTNCWGCILLLLMLTLLSLSFGIPILGIIMQVNVVYCEARNNWTFIAYCGFNMGRYLLASCVRLLMIIASIEVNRIWSVGSLNCDINGTEDVEANQIEVFLQDWTASSKNHDQLSQQYEDCGKKSQQIGEIFKMWFIVPWITFFIATSVKTRDVLGPWLQDKEEKEDDEQLLPAVYYMTYNIFQVISLLVAYITALKMNSHHDLYYELLRKKQLSAYKSSSRRAFARIMYIEKNKKYDFVPRVAFTDIKIRMENPLYVILLLLGIFFTIGGALF